MTDTKQKHLHTFVNQNDPYNKQLLDYIKEKVIKAESKINICELIETIGIIHPGSCADIRQILNEFIEFKILRFDYDIRYLRLNTLGLIYFDFIEYRKLNDNDNPTAFTIHKFYKNVSNGYLNNYDGYGYYGANEQESNVIAHCDEDLISEVKKTDMFTHVHWYNK